jgi:hypothetical protein
MSLPTLASLWKKSHCTILYKNNSGLVTKAKVKYVDQTTITNGKIST